ncbi:serpin family protein, partial [Streptomyces sp. CB01881]|uniref:serpin family protein n=1 Tax=Streptomyces sp. CB01881 TaxID=2078691 RepID=UPI001F4FEFEF
RLGMRADAAAEQARALLGTLRGLPGVSAALGLWTTERFPPRPDWLAGLPADVHGGLTGDEGRDRKVLDAWAARATGGLIDRMPVAVTEDTVLVLASALTVRTDWIQPFQRYWPELNSGPWAGRPVQALDRWTHLLDRAAVADTPAGPVTEVRVLGRGDIDVHLLLGEPAAAPGRVLAAGIGILSHRHPRVTADRLPVGSPGPGLSIGWSRSYTPEPELNVMLAEFTVQADHDLLARPGLFGLTTAATGTRTENRLPGVVDAPWLFVDSARQAATATFGERGFRAAAVTAIGSAGGSAATRPPYVVRHVKARFDRPFGFLAVHRTSRLVFAAGWVTEPDEYQHD